MGHPTARERIARLTRSFDEQDADLVASDPLRFEGYPEQVRRAQSETGLAEACVWGWAEVEGVRFALVVLDFAFLGGSMGVAVGEKVARAFDAARLTRAPVVTVAASGGARMQEGMAALVQMASTAEARRRHAAAGLCHISVLASPTTGGVYASFASLADVVLVEPEATVGFAGPRVVAELTGSRPAARIHTAEFAYEHGLVDAIVPEAGQPATIARILRATTPGGFGGAQSRARQYLTRVDRSMEPGTIGVSPPDLTAWDRLQLSRHPHRPRARQIIDAFLASSFELRGDRTGATDDAHVAVCIGGVASTSINVVAIGQDASGDGRIRPQGFRKAIRAIELAGRLGLPVVTIIDTRGADPLPSSEGHGVAAAIARTFEAMLACPSPTLAAITGEGGSGGALAMAPADRVLAWENAVFSVIAPEGAAAILYRDASRAPELAERLRITASDLLELGVVDAVVPEPPEGAQASPQIAAQYLADVVGDALKGLTAGRTSARLRRRHRRWRGLTNRFIRQAPG